MKKYLMNAALTLALGGLMVSCSDDNVDFVSIANQKAQAFEKVFNDFAAEYGGINPNNTWGFTDDYTVADTTGVEAVVTVEDEVESTLLQTRAALLDGIRARTRATESEWTGSYAHSMNDYLNPNSDGTLSIETMQNYTAFTDADLNASTHTLSDLYYDASDSYYPAHGDGKHYRVAADTEITEVFHINATYGVYNDAVIYIEGKVHLKGNTLNGVTLVVASGGEISVDETTNMSNAGRIVVMGGGKITCTSDAQFNVNNGSPCYNAGTITSNGTLNVNGCDFYNCGTIDVDILRNTAGGKFTNFGSITARTNIGAGDAYNSTMINGCNWTFKENAGIGSLINLNNSRLDVGGRAEFNSGDQYLYNYSVINAGSLYVNSTKFYGGTSNASDAAIIKTGKIYFAHDMLINQDPNQPYQNDRYTWLYKELTESKTTIYLDWDPYETYDKEGNKITDDNGYTRLSIVLGSPWHYVTDANTPFNINDVNCGGNSKPNLVITTGKGKKEFLIDDWYEVESQRGRIFCEDLGQATREDLDYNDVVFDVHIWQNHYKVLTDYYNETYTYTDGVLTDYDSVYDRTETTTEYTDNYAEVILKAAGGTLPLQVVGKEVHEAFGVDVATMVNTRDGNSTAFGSYESRDEVAIGDLTKEFTDIYGNTYTKVLTKGPECAINVPIVVNYDGNEVQELHANPGKAPHKLLVPLGTPWATERKNLALAYPDFGNFINDADKVWTNNPNTAYIYSGNTASTESPKVFRTVRVINSSDDILWSTTTTFGDSWTLQSQNITLNVDKFWPGDILRFHCKGIPANTDDQAWINIKFDGIGQVYDGQVVNYDPQTGAQSSTCCVEFLITEALAEKMNSAINGSGTMQITVAGRNFTLDRVARKPFDK